MLALPSDVQAFVDDSTHSYSARFAVERLAEALDPTAPLMHSAAVHSDPRIVARDLTAAIDWCTQANTKQQQRQAWALLLPRLRRVQALMKHDQAFSRWFDQTASDFVQACASLPSNPKEKDWKSAGGHITSTARALRDSLLTESSGYRARLVNAVCDAFQKKITSPAALRRLDERIGLLAAMLIDEGRDRTEVCETLVDALAEAARHQVKREAMRALSSGWKEYEVAVASVGFSPESWTKNVVAGARPIELRSLWRLLRDGWSPLRVGLLVSRGLLEGADGFVLATTRARGRTHAVRNGRALARLAADHQSVSAAFRRPRPLSTSLLRERDSDKARIAGEPQWHRQIAAPLAHPAVTISGPMSFLRRAVGSESDVERVLFGFIGIEALGVGRSDGDSAQRIVAREIPDFAWLVAMRATFMYPLQRLKAEHESQASMVWAAVAGHIDETNKDWERRWLDVLEGVAPRHVQTAFESLLRASGALTNWRVSEASARLQNGKLLIQQLNRHRTKVDWALNRTREARNAIAHSAITDARQMSAAKALRRNDHLPTDARVLGRFAVSVLSEIGQVAAVRMTGTSGQISKPEAYLRDCAARVKRLEEAAQSVPLGSRVRRKPPELP